MKRTMLQILIPAIMLLFTTSFLNASEINVTQLMNNIPVSADNRAEVRFKLPQKQMISAKLKLTVYNGDPERRLTPELYINGVGGKIAYTITDNVADGFVPSKQTRTWTFDLNKDYSILIKRGTQSGKNSTYVPIQDSERILDTNYLQILSRSGEHTLLCRMDAQGSKVSAELIIEYSKSVKNAQITTPQNIQTDAPDDIRIKLAVSKLKKLTKQTQFSHIIFIIGKKITEPIIGKPDLNDLGNEGFYIKSIKKSDKLIITVTGSDNQGIAYGVLRLVRIMLSAPDQLPSLNLRMKPALTIREMYEEHGWANPREFSSYKLLLNRYFEESINTIDLPVGWFISPDYYLKGASSKDKENLEVVKKVIEYAHSLGIKVYIAEDAYLNPLYNEKPENIANIDPAKLSDIQCLMESGSKEPLMLCLANPISRDLIKRNREYLYKYFTDADGVVIYFGDPGGCYHKECLPHGEKIVQYMNEIYAPLFKETSPDMKAIVTLWGIGLEDTEYVVKHLSELPKNVIAIQIPPTNMRAGDYLTFEQRRGDLIREAGKTLPVIVQQFYDGVGFRNGWVDLWEHPMPREMSDNFRGSWKPDNGIIGTYGSTFDINNQLIDIRIGMEWGWHPTRDAFDTIKEFGDEQFGLGSGEFFAKAIYSIDDYWSREVRRFHFDSGTLSETELADLTKSLNDSVTAKEQFVLAEKFVKRNRLLFKSYSDLSEIMLCTARVNMLRDKALKLTEAGDKGEALKAANQALSESIRAVDLVKTSERYKWIANHPWWNWWDIGRRPDTMRALIGKISEK